MAAITPTGTVDGSNATFTVPATIANEQLFVDRLLQFNGTDYTTSGTTITFLAGSIPQVGATLTFYNGTTSSSPSGGTPGVTTLATMTLQAQQRADMVNSSFISAAEWTSMVNASCQNLWDKLIEAYGNDYEMGTPASITTDGVNDTYALASDFYKLAGVDLQISNAGAGSSTGWISLRRFNFADRNKYTLPNVQTLWGRTNLQVRLRGSNLWFIPLPQAAMPARYWYFPRFTPLVNGTDTFDAINGWEEWVINDVAKKALTKEESDTSGVDGLQAVQNDRLASIIENRDAGSPSTMVDVTGINGGNYGEWGGGDWCP